MANYVVSYSISQEAALKAVSVALAEGTKQGLALVATVVDPALQLIAFCRADGANPTGVESSRRTAQTAVVDDMPSGWMNEISAVMLPLASGNATTNMAGGFPIRFDGRLVGGLGIGGAAPDDNIAMAKATLAAIGADVD